MSLTVADGFPYYASLALNIPVKSLFADQSNFEFYNSITEEKSKHRYATGKWSIKQIVGHIADHERIMTYRILRFSRRDATVLPGYDQEVMVNNSRFDEFTFADLVQDLKDVRQASISLLRTMSEEQMQLHGKVGKYDLTVEEYWRSTMGHERHHVQVLHERYLSAT